MKNLFFTPLVALSLAITATAQAQQVKPAAATADYETMCYDTLKQTVFKQAKLSENIVFRTSSLQIGDDDRSYVCTVVGEWGITKDGRVVVERAAYTVTVNPKRGLGEVVKIPLL